MPVLSVPSMRYYEKDTQAEMEDKRSQKKVGGMKEQRIELLNEQA